jgi:large subunit ribosomal protein L5e
VKFRRRRENKTDYQQRRSLITQDKTKYNSPKYRLVVRFSNRDVVCQIAYATIKSDVVLTAAYAHELSQYGAPIYKKGDKGGLKNYAAAYATGLLVARRLLGKVGLDKQFVGQDKPDGKDFVVQEVEGQRAPFKVLLDVGLHYTTTGARVFGALKGAVDGGLNINHNHKRFPGYNYETSKFDSRKLRASIFGGPTAEYMKKLQESNPEKYQKHFASYIKAGKGPDDLEKMWAAVHVAIRANPAHKKVVRTHQPKKVSIHKKQRNLKEKKNRVNQMLQNKI